MTRIVEVPLEPLSDEAFAPFGQIIGEQDRKPLFEGSDVKTWTVDFRIEGTLELHYVWFDYRPHEATSLERHFTVTQSFIPLGNAPSVNLFAAPTDPDDRDAIPKPEDMRAFYFGGETGVMMWTGTWHSGRFPAQPPGGPSVLITSKETTVDLDKLLKDGRPGRLTQVVDYAAQFDTKMKIVDPSGLLG